MVRLADSTGHELILKNPASRIISLVPSQTEFLAYLGLDEEVVGITKFCVHPASWRKRKTIVGGTKSVHMDRIHGLDPDLVIGNKEENTREMVEELREYYPCYVSDVNDLDSACRMMSDLGSLTGRSLRAEGHIGECRALARNITADRDQEKSLKVAYVIWLDPLMVVGGGTYIDHMIRTLGWENAFGNMTRYPEITPEVWHAASPDVVLLSSEPFPFRKVHFHHFRTLSPDAYIRIVDGELFSWYGWRLVKALTILPALRSDILNGC